MADKVITSTGDCSACCEPPADCSCALMIPPFEPWPYADYATAAAAIDDYVSNCVGFIELPTGTLSSFLADLSTPGELGLSSTISGPAGSMAAIMYASLAMKAGAMSLNYAVSAAPTCTPGDPIPCPGEPAFSSASYSGNTDFGGGRSIDFSGTLTWISGTTYSFTGSATLIGPWGGGAVTSITYGGSIPSGGSGSIPRCANLNVSIHATVTGGTNPGTYFGTGHSWSPPGYANAGSATCGQKSITASLYSCDGTLLEQQSATGDDSDSGTFNFTVSLDGEYIIKIETTGSDNSTNLTSDATATSTEIFTVNPVIALWDDSGTTRSLWACPKLLLPPLTESTGTWYADCAAADAAISAQASNCVGFMETTPFTAFVATDGGTSLTLVLTGTGDSGSGPENDLTAWGGFNAEAGETISITFSSVGGFSTTYYAEIYDDLGVSVESFSAMSGSPFVSSALPYTGRYSIRVRFNTLLAPSPATIVATFTITSSGTMSVNEIQALYDVGLDCPARLDCGDACP